MREQRILNFDPYLGGLLLFFLNAVRRHLLLVLGLTAATTTATFLVVRQLPPTYEAQASVRVGRVDGVDLMSLQASVSQLNSLPFKRRILQALDLPDKNGRNARLISSSIVARPELPDSMLVSVQAADAQGVQQALAVIVRLLNEDQERIRAPMIADINEQLATIDADVSDVLQARQNLAMLVKTMSEPQSSDSGPSAFRSIWLLDLVQRNENRLAILKAERYARASRLALWRTYPTALVDGAYVTPRKVSPRPVRAMIAVGGLTLLVTVLYALVRQPWPVSRGGIDGRRFGSPQGSPVADGSGRLDPAGKASC